MATAPAGYDGTVPRTGDGERLVAGMDVFGRDGGRVGTVADIGRGYFLAQDGLLTIRSLYLPSSLVARIDAAGAHLSVAKGEAEAMARQSPPPEGTAWYGRPEPGATTADVRVVEIPLREQILATRTVATVTNEITIRKEIARDIAPVATTVRREEAHVEGARRDVAAADAGTETSVDEGGVPWRASC